TARRPTRRPPPRWSPETRHRRGWLSRACRPAWWPVTGPCVSWPAGRRPTTGWSRPPRPAACPPAHAGGGRRGGRGIAVSVVPFPRQRPGSAGLVQRRRRARRGDANRLRARALAALRDRRTAPHALAVRGRPAGAASGDGDPRSVRHDRLGRDPVAL